MKIKFVRPQLREILANPDHSLMRNLQDQQIPVASSCGGEGICGKCKVAVIEGSENLSVQSSQEADLLKRLKADSSQRLSCQCFVSGDVVIDASYW